MQPDAQPTRPLRVALVVNNAKPQAVQAARAVSRDIEAHAILAGAFDAHEHSATLMEGVDLAVVLGGDGTILGLGPRAVEAGVAVLGINFGKLGFLAEFDPSAFHAHAAGIFSGGATIREVAALDAHVVRDGQTIARRTAINDVAICNGAPFRMIELGLHIEPQHEPQHAAQHAARRGPHNGPRVAGDGLIVATPTGSTAYNAAAGGPILEPTLPAMVVTPIAAHSLSFRPIVVPASATVEVTAHRVNRVPGHDPAAGTCAVVDGQHAIALEALDRVRVTVGDKPLRLVVNPDRNYWRTLAHKLQWASTPGG